MGEEATEANYSLSVIVAHAHQRAALDEVKRELEAANYPVGDLDVQPFGEDEVEIQAQLAPTSVDADELNALKNRLGQLPGVSQAYWSSRSDD